MYEKFNLAIRYEVYPITFLLVIDDMISALEVGLFHVVLQLFKKHMVILSFLYFKVVNLF